jgi:hypothetical protein
MAVPQTYAVVNPRFQPAMRVVTAITNALEAAVTTSFDHNYLTGLIVRLYVPKGYGMLQVDQQVGTITVTGDTTFTIDLDTTLYDTFTTPAGSPWYINSYSMVVPVGEINSSLTQATRNVS